MAVLLSLAGWLWAAGARAADTIEVQSVQIDAAAADDGWVLSAGFALPLPDGLVEAVNRGVPLYFVVEFELSRRRWYWWDERVVQATQTWRLSYHALTRQYRLTRGGYTQAYDTLESALSALTRVRGWAIAERDALRPGTEYDAALRMKLDVSMLPKPFQVTAITNRDWTLANEWKHWKFTP